MTTYKTSKGRSVDIDRFRIQYEKEVSAGNMNINAHGDKIDSKGNVVEPAEKKSKAYYKNPTSVKKISIKDSLDTKETVELPILPQVDTTVKSKKNTKNKNETILDNGDIVINNTDTKDRDE